MKLEIWTIVGAGIVFATALGALAVLLLGLHSEVRRLSKLAEAVRRLLADNLRQMLAGSAQAQGPPVEPLPLSPQPEDAPRPTQRLQLQPPLQHEVESALMPLSSATAALGAGSPGPVWHPDRQSLVLRLASRGKKPDQIAAALHIPQGEVENFLEANGMAVERFDSASP